MCVSVHLIYNGYNIYVCMCMCIHTVCIYFKSKSSQIFAECLKHLRVSWNIT